jgi:hypothetical protein
MLTFHAAMHAEGEPAYIRPMTQPPANTRELTEFVINSWRIDELAGFAAARRGYGNDGYGVTYPEDLDPGDEPMTPGTVEIYGAYGEAFSFTIAETAYLAILADTLRRAGRSDEAETVAALPKP